MQALERRDPGATASAVLALAVHVILVLVLFFGIRWKTSQPAPVTAELWSQLPAIETPRPPPPVIVPRPEPKPEPRPEPKAEPKPEPKPDIALEEAKKRREEAEKKKRDEEVQKRKRDEELKAKADEERKDKELAEKRRREETESERKRMQDQLARELSGAAPKAAAPVTGVPAAVADRAATGAWRDQISARVKSNIVLPPDLAGNPEAVFDVFLLPTGEVQSVKLVRSSGSKVLDDAWERAILKSSPLPRPAKAEIFQRDLRLVFRPND